MQKEVIETVEKVGVPIINFKNIIKKYKDLLVVNDISFKIYENQGLGIVGESGCGKSTIAKMILRLEKPTSGNIYFNDEDIWKLNKQKVKNFYKNVQMVFQDSKSSLNPHMNIYEIISEPIKNIYDYPKRKLNNEVHRLLEMVKLNYESIYKKPGELSGGQRQRVAIARALSINPKLIVMDEATSNLDVSIQAEILNLILGLKKDLKLSFLIISHDIGLVKYLTDDVLVMYEGKIIETLDSNKILEAKHPYSKKIIESVL